MTRFTDLGIERIKTPKQREKLQTEGNGLYIKTTPRGKKSWHHYGKTRQWSKLGDYPALSLKEAREKNEEYKNMTDRGLNPAEINMPSSDPTVREFYQRWFDEGVDKNGAPWSEDYRKNVYYIFRKDVLPYIGGVKVREIQKSIITHLLQRVVDRGAANQARQVYLRLQRFLNYAAELDIIEVSPMASMPTKGASGNKDRALKTEEIKLLIEHFPIIDMDARTARILELILRTGQRPTECAGIHVDEIEGHWWTIPGDRTKNGLVHRVFLTDEALALLIDPGPNGYYFESYATGQPIHRNALSKAIRRSLYGKEKTQKDKTPTLKIDPFTPHDLRRTCATHLAELGFTDDVIGAVLNHKKRSVTGIYNRHQYDKEKQKAMIAWSQKLKRMMTESDNVVSIGKSRRA